MSTQPILSEAPPAYSQISGTTNEATPAVVTNEPPPQYEAPKENTNTNAGYPNQHYPLAGYQTAPAGVVLVGMSFGPSSQHMQCPHCLAYISTATEFQPGCLTWVSATMLCLLGLWMGCCLIPFCVDGLQNVHHSCPNCHNILGTYERL